MIKPHGSDELNPLFVYDTEKRHALVEEAEGLPSILLSSAAAANAVMLGGGYFNPLTGYMNLADALSVAEKMRTVDGLFFPVPIVNMTDEPVEAGSRIALRDPNVESNPVLAVMDVGLGFQGSLAAEHARRYGDRWSAATALEAAFLNGESRFRDPGRGQGLQAIRKQVRLYSSQ